MNHEFGGGHRSLGFSPWIQRGWRTLHQPVFFHKASSFALLTVSMFIRWCDVDDTVDQSRVEPVVIVVSFPQYCRYRAMAKRLEKMSSSWLQNVIVQAISGMSVTGGDVRLMFCQETFEHPVLTIHDFRKDCLGKWTIWDAWNIVKNWFTEFVVFCVLFFNIICLPRKRKIARTRFRQEANFWSYNFSWDFGSNFHICYAILYMLGCVACHVWEYHSFK